MAFMAPALLFALPLALAPLLLHLFFQRRRSNVQFSTLAFLERNERHFAYRRRIQELLLLLFRTGVLALCILALARPCIKRHTFLGTARTEAILILDDTMSMQRTLPGGKTAFELAVQQAESLMNTLDKEDSAGLVWISGRDGLEPMQDKQHLVGILRSAKPTGASGNLPVAIAKAAELLRHSKGLNQEVYLLTDLQQSMLPDRAVKLSELGNARLYLLPIQGSQENASVRTSLMELSAKTPGTTMHIPFTIRNMSPNDRAFRAELKIAGATMHTENISVKANSTATAHFPYIPERPGRVEGSIVIDDANVPMDNAAHFAFTVTDTTKALLLSGGGKIDPFFYLKMAIEPRKGAYGLECTSGTIQTLPLYDLRQYQLIFLSSKEALPPAALQKFREYLQEGGCIIAVPDGEEGLRHLTSLLPAGEPSEEAFEEFSASGIRFRSALNAMNSPLQLELLQWRKLVPLQTGGDVLAECKRRPVMTQQTIGNGRIILLAFDLRRRCSNWPELKSFPIVMNALVKHASGQKERTIQVNCGTSLKLNAAAISYTSSDSTSGILTDGIFKETWFPGVTRFSGGPYECAILTPQERESDLQCASPEATNRLFDGPVSLLSLDEEPLFQIQRLRRGTEISGACLLAALLMLVAEFLLAWCFTAPGQKIREYLKSLTGRHSSSPEGGR